MKFLACTLLLAFSTYAAKDCSLNNTGQNFRDAGRYVCDVKLDTANPSRATNFENCLKENRSKYPRTYDSDKVFSACGLVGKHDDPDAPLCPILKDPTKSCTFVKCVEKQVQADTGNANKELGNFVKLINLCKK